MNTHLRAEKLLLAAYNKCINGDATYLFSIDTLLQVLAVKEYYKRNLRSVEKTSTFFGIRFKSVQTEESSDFLLRVAEQYLKNRKMLS